MMQTEQFLTYAEYKELARRYLINFLRRGGRSMKNADNQDAMDYIITYMMKADEVFDGRGNREGFRWQYAQYGYRTYLTRKRKLDAKGIKVIQMSAIKKMDEKQIDVTVDSHDHTKAIETEDLKKKIMESLLSDYEKESVIGTYFNHETQEQIADRIGVARGYISMLLKTAMKKLEKVLDEYKP